MASTFSPMAASRTLLIGSLSGCLVGIPSVCRRSHDQLFDLVGHRVSLVAVRPTAASSSSSRRAARRPCAFSGFPLRSDARLLDTRSLLPCRSLARHLNAVGVVSADLDLRNPGPANALKLDGRAPVVVGICSPWKTRIVTAVWPSAAVRTFARLGRGRGVLLDRRVSTPPVSMPSDRG